MSTSFFNVYTTPAGELSACLMASNTTTAAANCALADAFSFNLVLMAAVALFVFLASSVTNNDSWVDRLWSIYPVVASWVFAIFRGLKEQKAALTKACPWCAFFKCPDLCSPQVIFCLLITIWGTRLTYNFYRRGGYKRGGEDYRWVFVRSWPIINRRVVWIPFSFLVVSLYQIALLFSITVPISQLPSNTKATYTDFIVAGLFLFFLVLETCADQHQWDFHQYKHGKRFPIPAGIAEDCKRGFMTHGLFSLSRHPNVFAEQSIWVVVFLSTLKYSGVSGSCVGALSLIHLTLGSSLLTESISVSKYPLYKVYQRTTPYLYPSAISTRHYIDASMAQEGVKPVAPSGLKLSPVKKTEVAASKKKSASPSRASTRRSVSAKRK